MTNFNPTRRSALQGLLAISAAGALSACGQSSTQPGQAIPLDDAEFASFKGFFSKEEMALLIALSDTILPATDTPGAVEAGVPEVLQGLATQWGDDDYRRYWRQGLRNLSTQLPGFDAANMEQRLNALGNYDAKVFAGDTEDGFYRDMKRTITTAYYMSEPGATQELSYEAVPGEWIGCVPLADYPKTWAT